MSIQNYSKYLDAIYDEVMAEDAMQERVILAKQRHSKNTVMPRTLDISNTRKSLVSSKINMQIMDCMLDQAINKVILANLLEKRNQAILAWNFPWSKKKKEVKETDRAKSNKKQIYTQALQEAYDKVFAELSSCNGLVELNHVCNPELNKNHENETEQQIKTQFFKVVEHFAIMLFGMVEENENGITSKNDIDLERDETWQIIEDGMCEQLDKDPQYLVKFFLKKIDGYKHNILQDMPDHQSMDNFGSINKAKKIA